MIVQEEEEAEEEELAKAVALVEAVVAAACVPEETEKMPAPLAQTTTGARGHEVTLIVTVRPVGQPALAPTMMAPAVVAEIGTHRETDSEIETIEAAELPTMTTATGETAQREKNEPTTGEMAGVPNLC